MPDIEGDDELQELITYVSYLYIHGNSKPRDLKIAHWCHTISRLRNPSAQSRDWHAISGFRECTAQSQDCTNS